MPKNKSQLEVVRLVNKVIGYQFPDTPEGKLCFAVVAQSIRDAFGPVMGERRSGAKYLKSDMPHAKCCGVEAEWIRKKIAKAGLNEVSMAEQKGEEPKEALYQCGLVRV